MHLHELLRQHPHLTDTFDDVFGAEAVAHALRLGAAYRLSGVGPTRQEENPKLPYSSF